MSFDTKEEIFNHVRKSHEIKINSTEKLRALAILEELGIEYFIEARDYSPDEFNISLYRKVNINLLESLIYGQYGRFDNVLSDIIDKENDYYERKSQLRLEIISENNFEDTEDEDTEDDFENKITTKSEEIKSKMEDKKRELSSYLSKITDNARRDIKMDEFDFVSFAEKWEEVTKRLDELDELDRKREIIENQEILEVVREIIED